MLGYKYLQLKKILPNRNCGKGPFCLANHLAQVSWNFSLSPVSKKPKLVFWKVSSSTPILDEMGKAKS